MLPKLFTLISTIVIGASFTASAKIWRINNNVGINANFTTFYDAAISSSVQPGDTIYLEPSAAAYGTNSLTLTKQLVIIGPGYFLDPADASLPYNPGLSLPAITAQLAFLRLGPGSDGSKFMSIGLQSWVYMNGANNVQFEKIYFGGAGVYFEHSADNISIRKSFFSGNALSNSPTANVTNLVVENNIFSGSYCTLDRLTGSGNIFRNNSIINSFNTWSFTNTYIANNIFGIGTPINLVNCTIKNNLFQVNQTLPGTATNNQVSVNMSDVYVGGSTGSLDSRCILKAGSPAIGAGLTVGSVVSPDCGAFGATDPYKLSGIPNIPSFYSLTVPVSIPSGTNTMNVTFSTRNNQ